MSKRNAGRESTIAFAAILIECHGLAEKLSRLAATTQRKAMNYRATLSKKRRGTGY